MDQAVLIRETYDTPIETLLLALREGRDTTREELSDEARMDAKNWLVAQGLTAGEENLANQIELNHAGQRLADALVRSRSQGEIRWDRVTRAVAAVLYEDGDEASVTEVDGQEVTHKERQFVLARMEKWGLIAVVKSGGDIVRADALPGLTEVEGIAGLLSDRFETVHPTNRTTNTTNIHGSTVGGVQTGSGNTMHVTQTVSGVERASILAKVSAVLAELDGVVGVDDVREAVEAVRDEAAQPTPSRERLKEKILVATSAAGTSAVVTAGMHQVPTLLSQLFQWVG